MHATFAVEKQLNSETTLKFKIQEDLDTDVAIKMRFSPGVSLTLCFGMALAERTEKGRAKVKKELEEDNEKLVKEWIEKEQKADPKWTISDKDSASKVLHPTLSALLKDPDNVWATPYFGINFDIKL